MEFIDYEKSLSETITVLQECFSKYKLPEIFFCFNGGKDCSVLLSITLEVLKKTYKNSLNGQSPLMIVYIRPENPFPELESFVDDTTRQFNLNMKIISGDIKTVIDSILKSNPELKACLMGSRRTDPYCENLDFFQMTDPNWPQIMRVSPILNWSYHEVWSFLLDKKVPYCKLYDQGYTSLGNMKNTVPNSHLVKRENGTTVEYLPAYLLKDASSERDGRNKT